MRKPFYFFLLLNMAFTILSCQNTGIESKEKPKPVQFVKKSDEHAGIERGIDAIPDENGIFFEWFKPSDSEIEKYAIYRTGEIEKKFHLIDTVEDTFYIDLNVELDKSFFYYVLAMNFDNQKSVSSDTINYKLLSKATRLSPSGIISSSASLFQWEDTNQAHEYIIRIQRLDTGEFIWIVLINAIYGTEHQQTSFNSDGTAIDQLISGIPYQWRVDVIGPETNSGSESVYTFFQIQ